MAPSMRGAGPFVGHQCVISSAPPTAGWAAWGSAPRSPDHHRVVGLCNIITDLYGYRPWLLETFVDETEHTGASLRAANWVRVGETCGRGRNDRTHAAPHTRKAVYMYELEPAWRERLALPAPGLAPLALGEGLDAGLGGERPRHAV